MKTILFATDCTSNAASILKYAYRFSSIMKADLHILHVYNFPPIGLSTIQPIESLKKRIHDEQIEVLKKYYTKHLKNEFCHKTIITHVVENSSVSESILRLSNILNPDLIMVGTKSEQNLRGLFAGNIANELLDNIDIPLLIVPKDVSIEKFSTIIYATDFEQEDFVAIQKLVEVAKSLEAFIEIIHVYKLDQTVAKNNMEMFSRSLSKKISYPEITFRTIASTKIKSGLLSVLNGEKASMLAMLERNQSWSFTSLFHKDLVKDMEATINIPILAFNKRTTDIELETVSQVKRELAY